MKIDKAEEIINKNGMSLKKRITYKNRIIYLADGFATKTTEYKYPHFQSMYLVARNAESVDVGQVIRFEQFKENGLSKDEPNRLAEAEKLARDFVDLQGDPQDYEG